MNFFENFVCNDTVWRYLRVDVSHMRGARAVSDGFQQSTVDASELLERVLCQMGK